jgi:hypothetical protein
MKIPEPGSSILTDGFEPSARLRGRNTVREASEVAVVIDSDNEPLGLASPDGLISSFFLLFASVGALRWTDTVPKNRPRALNMRTRRRPTESAIMAKTPCSMLLNRMTTTPMLNMMRSCTMISHYRRRYAEETYCGRYSPECDQSTWRRD